MVQWTMRDSNNLAKQGKNGKSSPRKAQMDTHFDDLAIVIDYWPSLSAHVKAKILKLVRNRAARTPSMVRAVK
jgi:hypothetical protein